MKAKIYILVMALCACFISCEEDLANNMVTSEKVLEKKSGLDSFDYKIEEDGILSFENEALLAENLNTKSYEGLRVDIRKLRNNGFVPLNPMFDENDSAAEQEYMSRRAKKAKKHNFFFTNKTFNKEDADLEDDVITDPKFAAILNEDREIYVGNKFYKYTPYGLFFSKRKYKKHLLKYLKELSTSKTGKSTATQMLRERDCKNMLKGGGNTGKGENITAIDDKISLYSSCGGAGGISIGGGGSGGSSSTPDPAYPFELKSDLPVCYVKKNSLWQMVFGPAETCHDYFDSKRRIKSKFWSQSYFVYASIGTSVKYQKKYWLGWQTSNAVDFTEMGINNATFTYKNKISIFDQTFKDIQNDVLIRWKNTVWTADGRQLTNLPFQLPSWPFKNGTVDKFEIEIYIFDKSLSYDDKQAYKTILKQAKKFIVSAGNKLEDLNEAVKQDNITLLGVTLVKNLDKTVVTISERFDRDLKDCCNSYTFDQNFLVELKFGFKGGNMAVEKQPGGNFTGVEGGYAGNETASWSAPIFLPKANVFNATKYEDFTIDFYGVAKRGEVYKGNRVLGNSKEL
ncbi:hypothetical protein MNBD_BACTEROID03-1284 [hydrothermal vent metagenome]|uniref:Lipoprotein n=1 Tax=hydrothermal vent metagenome TaxID=652676 RepID=A0A3B0TBU9_9ZZZZ